MTQGFYLKVVRGNPTAEELAALITVLSARAASQAGGDSGAHPSQNGAGAGLAPEPASAWLDGSRTARKPSAPSASAAAWRVSGWAG
ncbi:acyl-CoA carboxylase subunit epsilon [Sphaerisporangium rhizosphaerae]|uniref:Acyl-CoA carboxylase subunit epsilon n=1 Tax=Sphaerisporangium rhizosphaerae TaxID=2269375 RepID=A0ABW2P723_9ACTN